MKNKKQVLMIIVGVAVIFLLAIMAISLRKGGQKANLPEIPENSSAAPLLPVIDGSAFPGLVSYENAIQGDYGLLFREHSQAAGQNFECRLPPEISALAFQYLKPRQTLYMITSYCEVEGGGSYVFGIPPILFFVTDGNTEMFFQGNITSHFTGAFNTLENADEAREYALLYVDSLSVDIATALNDSLLQGYTVEDFEKDCPLPEEVPAINDMVIQSDGGFLYRGFIIEPEFHARAYYREYSISTEGDVKQESDKMLAMCKDIGVIY